MPRQPPRIVAGRARGRRLYVPAGDRIRPTKDRVKEAVFSALDARGLLLDAVVLDVCAGSGALGLEALSRGATSATFVERDRTAVDALRNNIAAIAEAGTASVIVGDALTFLATSGGGGRSTFDLVFVDPPYSTDALERDALGGTIVVETAATTAAPEAPVAWSVTWERRFGDTLVVFLQPAAEAG
jgi:16S rRNA (guanine966-N2)-methyltransferase